MKTCTKCGQRKSVLQFSGFESRCKQCCASRSRKYHRHHRIAQCRRMTAYHNSHKQQAKTRAQKYAAAHRELATAKNHYRFAHCPQMWQFKHYHNMKFYHRWDTAKNKPKAAVTFAHNAEIWMQQHCPCPGAGWELHIEKTVKYPNGYFGPGGFRWLRRADVHQKMELATAMRIVEAAGYTIQY